MGVRPVGDSAVPESHKGHLWHFCQQTEIRWRLLIVPLLENIVSSSICMVSLHFKRTPVNMSLLVLEVWKVVFLDDTRRPVHNSQVEKGLLKNCFNMLRPLCSSKRLTRNTNFFGTPGWLEIRQQDGQAEVIDEISPPQACYNFEFH